MTPGFKLVDEHTLKLNCSFDFLVSLSIFFFNFELKTVVKSILKSERASGMFWSQAKEQVA